VDDGFVALDRDCHVRFVNAAAARLLGSQVEELLGTDMWTSFPDALGAGFDLRCHEAMESQQRVEFLQHLTPADSWLSIRVNPSVDGVTLVLRDVTRLHQLVAERRGSVDRLVAAEDRERARIAADVHEDSVQALGVISLQLQLLTHHLPSPTPEVEQLLESLREQTTRATDRLRALLFSLEPTDPSAPIAASIRTQAAHVFEGSPMHWSVDDIDVGEELPPAERSQALRITKEALSNACAHADASEVIVTLLGDADGLEIVIADNGVASDPASFISAAGHRGLSTMRDRASAVGGRCTFERSTPTGCTVRVYLPRVLPC
jgi:signal transduction histidine kinase